jgi:hypothetical protein
MTDEEVIEKMMKIVIGNINCNNVLLKTLLDVPELKNEIVRKAMINQIRLNDEATKLIK